MKRYKLLKDLPTFNKGDTFRLTEHGHLMSEEAGVIAYAEPTLEKFNILDSEWLEEIPEEYKRWRANTGSMYWYISDSGSAVLTNEAKSSADDARYTIGNYFRTYVEAEKAANWLKAFTILRDDTKGFKANWRDEDQEKWSVVYDYENGTMYVANYYTSQKSVLYFATQDDAEESIKAHERQWLAFFGVEE